MKISRIKIENFRSIENSEFNCSNFNIFVGRNNAGKTNFFEAIEWFYNGTTKGMLTDDLKFKRLPGKEILVEVEFTEAQHGAENMKNEANKTKMLSVLDGSDSIVVRRLSSDAKKRVVEVNGSLIDKLPTGFDKAFNDFLPKFEYINTKQYFDAVAKYSSRAPVGIMLSSVLETILETNKQYSEFKEKFEALFEEEGSEVKAEFDRLGKAVKVHLEKQFSDCTNVKFEVSSPEFEDLLKNFETTVDDGVETYAHEKGDGMQRALMLAIIQAYADFRKKREDAGKSFLFFIDEAELHLHPTAQRRLKTVLLELCEDLDQVFMNTHSSVFVADDHELQTIHKVEKINSITNFDVIDEFDKPHVVFELLGGSPADLLLPNNFLIVEGPSEIEFLSRVVRRFYADKPRIQIVSAEGDSYQAKRSINAVRKVFSPLNESIYEKRVVILCDKPSNEAKKAFAEFKKEFKAFDERGQLCEMTETSLEESYPDHKDWIRTSVQVKAMPGDQKKKLARRIGDEITKEQFENEMKPVADALGKTWELAF